MMLAFQGVSRPVALIGCDEAARSLSALLRGWCFTEVASASELPVLTARRSGAGYSLESPWKPSPVEYCDLVDLVCAMIVDLVRAYADGRGSLLCLHAAAAEFAGRLVIFPCSYRAGKSTFAAALAAAGSRIWADDVIAMSERRGTALALGAAPRLRLPLPKRSSARFRRYLETRIGPGNKRYLYLDLDADALASHGMEARVGGFILLDRVPGAEPELARIERSTVLQTLVVQNFARQVPAIDILGRLHALVDGMPCYSLRYGEAEDAVCVVREAFARWPSASAGADGATARPAIPPARRTDWRGPCFRRGADVVETALEDDVFLARPDGAEVYRLNPTGAALWRLFAKPVGAAEAGAALSQAFPDVAPHRIKADVVALIADLAERGLIEQLRGDESRA